MSLFSHYNGDLPKTRDSNWDSIFKQAKTIWDPHFGEIEIQQDPRTNGEIMCKTKTLDNYDDLKSNVEFLTHRQSISHPNLATLLDFSYTSVTDWCSAYYILKTYYESFPHPLSKELQTRVSLQKPFVDEELFLFIYEQVDILAQLQSRNICHGDLRPDTIFLTNENGIVLTKLTDRINSQTLDALGSQKAH
jgi:serine/threonine protein kinase